MSKPGRRTKPYPTAGQPLPEAPQSSPAQPDPEIRGDGRPAGMTHQGLTAVGDGAPYHVDPERERPLVESARDGDPGSIEALYRTHYATIYRYVLFRVGSAAAAEDVTSQVFLGMVRQLPRFRWEGKPFLSWLYAIAQRQVAMHHRSAGRAGAPMDLDQAETLIGDTAGPHADAEERERRVALARALRVLPDTQREVLLLRYILSLSLAETAAAVGKSEGAIKQLQVRGLATLRDVLGGSLR